MTDLNGLQPVLTEEQLVRFRADGVLHLPGLIPETVYGPVRDDLGALIEAAKDGPAPDYTYLYHAPQPAGGTPTLYRINELIGLHDLESLKLLLAYPPLLTAVHQAMGGKHFAATAAAAVFKLPYSQAAVGWHQDANVLYRWPVFDTDIYLDHSDPDSGCLWAIPGSHLAGFPGRSKSHEMIASYTGGKQGGDVPGAVPIAARPGDVNLHSASVIHGSFRNSSNRHRRIVYLHWDNRDDLALKPVEQRHRMLYLWAQNLLRDSIDLRQQRNPREEPFPYETIEPALLPGSTDQYFSFTQYQGDSHLLD